MTTHIPQESFGYLADSTDPKNTQDVGGNQADKLIEASVPYELQRGGIYIVEVKDWAWTSREAMLATDYYKRRYNIDIQFVFTHGNDFGLRPVPALEADDPVIDLAKKGVV